MKFYSPEFWEAVKEKANVDEKYLRKARGLTLSYQLLVLDCPGNVDRLVTVTMEKGKVVSCPVEEAPAPSPWRTQPVDGTKYLFRNVASYETFAKLNRKEITPMGGISTGAFKIEGELTRVLGKMAEFLGFIELISTVPCEY